MLLLPFGKMMHKEKGIPNKNALNKINLIPCFKPVNEKGIAEAVFRLPAYTMAVQIANARIAAGDKMR